MVELDVRAEDDAGVVASGIDTDSEVVRKGVTTGRESVATTVEGMSATETAMGEPVTLTRVLVEVIVMLKMAVAMGLGARSQSGARRQEIFGMDLQNSGSVVVASVRGSGDHLDSMLGQLNAANIVQNCRNAIHVLTTTMELKTGRGGRENLGDGVGDGGVQISLELLDGLGIYSEFGQQEFALPLPNEKEILTLARDNGQSDHRGNSHDRDDRQTKDDKSTAVVPVEHRQEAGLLLATVGGNDGDGTVLSLRLVTRSGQRRVAVGVGDFALLGIVVEIDQALLALFDVGRLDGHGVGALEAGRIV